MWRDGIGALLAVLGVVAMTLAPLAEEAATTQQATVSLDPLSGRSLYLKLSAGRDQIGTATGFVIEDEGQYFLVTNWHVVSGRNPDTNRPILKSGAVPDRVTIVHHGQRLGTWVEKTESLYDTDGGPRWIEHARGRQVDVALLPLESLDQAVQIYPFDLSLADTDMVAEVAMPVSIIGFPLGLSGPGVFPIWKTGHIASEPELDYKGQPVFLIDATTRGGMSGSPVVLRLSGGFKTRSGNTVMSQTGHRTRFLGIYAGRIGGDSEVGRVWRPWVVREVLAHRRRSGP